MFQVIKVKLKTIVLKLGYLITNMENQQKTKCMYNICFKFFLTE